MVVKCFNEYNNDTFNDVALNAIKVIYKVRFLILYKYTTKNFTYIFIYSSW